MVRINFVGSIDRENQMCFYSVSSNSSKAAAIDKASFSIAVTDFVQITRADKMDRIEFASITTSFILAYSIARKVIRFIAISTSSEESATDLNSKVAVKG
jgi:hypothetical protein